jgi:hypothetical protein
MSFRETWNAAKNDPSNGELTYRQWGIYGKRGFITHGWWVDPNKFALSAGLSREASTVSYEGNATFAVEIGPFTWGIILYTPKLTGMRLTT